MDGHWPPGAQTAGKQALMVIEVLFIGISYVQQGAFVPHDVQAVPNVTDVQKHGMLAGMV
jgi:hypothetical protein